MQEQRAAISIRLKAVLLTGAILTVTFAAVIVFTVESQRRNLRANIEARLSSNTQTLESVLESVMLSGQAEIMNDTLARLREIDDFSELIIYRTDGSRAFGGGATTEAERAATLAMPAMQQALASSEPVQVPSADGTAIEYYSPIVAKDACFECHDPGEAIRGVEYFRISMADSLEQIRRSSTLLAGFLLFAAVMTGIAFVMFLGRLVTRPVTQLSQVALSLERGDLTHTVEVRSRDEVGMLSRALATFLRTLNGVVRQVKSMAGRSRTVGNELATAADNALRTVEEMRGAVGRFAQVVTTLDEEVEQSRASAGDVDSRTTAIVDVIAQQATAITQASASVEQMTASIEELSRTADTKLAVAVEIGEDAGKRQSELERAVAGIKRLAESTSEVQQMITEISDIAAQTDLLAMNAAIEAAHAGEYGRGFAVVADEVRKLSVSSATFARRISETLASVVASIEETERRSLETAGGIRKSAGDIRGVADSLEEIRTANRELAVGSKEVLQALSLLSGSATEVTDSTRSISDRVREIAASLDRLGNTSSAAREGVTNLAAGIEQVHAASNVVAETGRDSAQRAAELDRAVEAFTVTEDDNHAPLGGAGGSQSAAAGVRDLPAAAPKPSAGSGANGENREIGETGQPGGAPTAAPPPAQRSG